MISFEKKRQQGRKKLLGMLLLALFVRLVLVVLTEGYSTDVSCFSLWAFRMADLGPSGFYAPDYFADYPPAYMLVLWMVGKLAGLLNLSVGSKGLILLLTIVPVLCDLGCAWLIYEITSERFDVRRALMFAAFSAFCPALLYDTAVWKQVDSVTCLTLLACFWLLSKRKWLAGAAVYGLSLAVKPQALLFGPVLAVCFLVMIFRQKSAKERCKALGVSVAGAALSVGVVLLSALPFGRYQQPGWLLDKYTGTVSSYPYASLNGFNLLTLLGGNWKEQTQTAFAGLSWQMLGTLGIAGATLVLIWLTVRSLKNQRFCPLLLAAFYGVAVFTLAHRMHERYILPAVLLTLAAAARWGDRRLLGSFWLLSLSSLLNQGIVLACNGTEDQFLTSSTSVVMIRLISLMCVAGFGLLCWAVCDITGGVRSHIYRESVIAPMKAQPVWTRKEGMLLALLTTAVAVLSLTGLGDFTAPQTPLDAIGGTKTQEIILSEHADEFRVYPGITWDGSIILRDEAGNELVNMETKTHDCFKWKKYPALELPAGRYTVEVTNNQLMEIAFFTPDDRLAVTGGGDALLDEQEMVPEEISYLNSTYFDEVYHARTGYEHLHGMPVYETTHPPLGKVFTMLGIAIFGMTGFGWRVMGTLFGVALVPVLYLFVRRLTRSKLAAGTAAVLAALDGMRFAQSRISTIDMYATFFILLGAYFMVWYCQSVLEKGVNGSLLPMALAGVAFGLGAASKWTGIYAGAGLAVLYFGVLWQRWKQKKPDFKKEFLTAIEGGVLFFVLIPLLIYMASYFPYFWREGGFSLKEWWSCQELMFNYHSGLTSTHPYESRWYSWPFAVRPVWYYLAGDLPDGLRGSISGMGNPVVWWAAALAIGTVLWRQFSGRASRAGGALTVLYFAQLLPWVLVSRSTFMYHYFPSLWFAVAAIGLVLADWYVKKPAAARRMALALVCVSLVVFICFYPVYSGIPVSAAWIEHLRLLDSWVF